MSIYKDDGTVDWDNLPDSSEAWTVPLRAVDGNGDNWDSQTPDELRSTWEPVDLTDALEAGEIPAPEYLARADGINLVYQGKTHWFQGEPESCKTWLAGAATAERLMAGEEAGWIDFEDDARTAVARLKALGVPNDVIKAQFTYIRPDEPLIDKQGRITPGHIALEATLGSHDFKLVTIDGVTEAMVTEGMNLLDNSDIALWLRVLPKRIASLGPAVICLDHVTKDREGQGRWAIGGQHKLAGLTGVAYAFEVIKPFARTQTTEPLVGTVFLNVAKDRAGYIRGASQGNRIAVMELTSYPDGGVTIELLAPDATPAPDLELCRRIGAHLGVYDEQSGRQIHMALGGNEQALRTALKWMAAEPQMWVAIDKKGRSHLHSLTPRGRTELL